MAKFWRFPSDQCAFKINQQQPFPIMRSGGQYKLSNLPSLFNYILCSYCYDESNERRGQNDIRHCPHLQGFKNKISFFIEELHFLLYQCCASFSVQSTHVSSLLPSRFGCQVQWHLLMTIKRPKE